MKRNLTDEDKESIKKQKNRKGQQKYRDTHKNTVEYRNKRRERYLKSKSKHELKSDEYCLHSKYCVDDQKQILITTPVGLIRYNPHKSKFKLQLESDCTALNVKGNGSYGLAIRKGSYCYKISVATQEGKGGVADKVNICCVKNFCDKVDENNSVKSIRLSKACQISFEKNSLYEISQIRDLRDCTASYIGMLANII
jgi:hypothetical protein